MMKSEDKGKLSKQTENPRVGSSILSLGTFSLANFSDIGLVVVWLTLF